MKQPNIPQIPKPGAGFAERPVKEAGFGSWRLFWRSFRSFWPYLRLGMDLF